MMEASRHCSIRRRPSGIGPIQPIDAALPGQAKAKAKAKAKTKTKPRPRPRTLIGPAASQYLAASREVDSPRPIQSHVHRALDNRLQRAAIEETQSFFWLILTLLLLGLVILGGVLLWSSGGSSRGGSSDPDSIVAGVPTDDPASSTRILTDSGLSGMTAERNNVSIRIPWQSYPAFDRVGPLPNRPAALDPLEWRTELDQLSERIFRTSGPLDETLTQSFGDLLARGGAVWPLLAPKRSLSIGSIHA